MTSMPHGLQLAPTQVLIEDSDSDLFVSEFQVPDRRITNSNPNPNPFDSFVSPSQPTTTPSPDYTTNNVRCSSSSSSAVVEQPANPFWLRNITPPQSKLPPELLGEIFEHCFPHPVIIPSRDYLLTSPYVLMQVCSTWREVAMRTPTLWSKVCLEVSSWKDIDKLVDRVHRHLSLSGASPVFLYTTLRDTPFYFATLPVPQTPEEGSDIIRRLIKPYTSRLKDLSLSFPFSWLQHLLTTTGARDEWSFPLLQSAQLDYSSTTIDQSDWFHKDQIDFFVNTPSLSCFKLTASPYPVHFRSKQSYQLPWSQLTELHICRFNLSMSSLFILLSSCSNLRSCTLTVTKEIMSAHVITPHSISVPTLLSLCLHNPHNFDYNRQLDSLLFPSLTHLSLLMDGRTSRKWTQAQLTAFVARNGCTLHTLHTTAQIEDQDIESVLGDVPSLKELDVQCGKPVSSSTLRFICHGLMAPNLEVIKCQVRSDMLNDFLDMLDCRYVPRKLKSRWATAGAVVTTYRGIVKAVIRSNSFSKAFAAARERVEELRTFGRDVVLLDGSCM